MFLYTTYIGDILGHTPNYKKLGQWVVVTGATDGIGKAYAIEFARRGMDIVLMSRTMSKLETLADHIRETYKVAVKCIQMNFVDDSSKYHDIHKVLSNMDIAVLVNNVGMNYEHPEYFVEINNDNFEEQILHCNCLSVTMMMKIILPGMISKKKGVILNMSSFAASIPGPLLAQYSATKTYVSKLSEALQAEVDKTGVIIQNIEPAFVCSNMSKMTRPRLFVPSAEQFVKAQLKTVSLQKNTYGYPSHKIQGAVSSLGISLVPSVFIYYYFKRMLGVRARSMKRKVAKTD